MKKYFLFAISLFFSAAASSPVLAVDFDDYVGDSSIYGVESASKPNVLIIVDNSGSMGGTVLASDYDPATTYTSTNSCTNQPGANSACVSNYVYRQTSYHGQPVYTLQYGTTSESTQVWVDGYWTGHGRHRRWVDGYWDTTTTYTYYPLQVSQVPATCGTLNPYTSLTTEGVYTGYQLSPQASSTSTATCTAGGSAGYTYVTGNYVNFTKSGQAYKEKIAIARDVVKNLIKTTEGVNFGLMTFRYNTSGCWAATCAQGGTFISKSVTFGTSTGTYVTTVKDMDATFPAGNTGNAACIDPSKCTNRDALIKAVDDLTDTGYTPLGETLFEAGRYFSGGAPAFGATIGVSSGIYTTPVVSQCQKNFVIFVTDGMSTADDSATLQTIGTNGDTDGDRTPPTPEPYDHSLDDVAKFLNTSTENIVSYYIGFDIEGSDAAAVALLTSAADANHGKGQYYSANSQIDLSNSLTNIMSEIYTVNSSYVAPVVPVSPQNRTYGSSRVFMGFFRPSGSNYWAGNLKKYGLGPNNYVMDVNGNYATWVDEDNNGVDDRDGTTLDLDASNGSFKSTAKSFWSTSVDAGTVKLGGAGEMLKDQTGTRNLYTYTGTSNSLTDASNQLSTTNTAITLTILGVADATAKDKLINFLQGHDAYNEDSDSDTTETRSWVMGDILHSRPLIINYQKYTFNTTNEVDSALNKTMIFVGGNDGMLHAFYDYNGREAWSFIPPDTLYKLKDLTSVNHPIFSDSSVSAYVYDKDNDGNIETADGDKVIMLFGERRGGGTHTSPTNGYYYALDVSNPTSPQYLWSISNATTGFGEMGESWSEPKIVKMKIGTATKIVAFFGAGYDNPNEDGRFGATQGFTGAISVPASTTGSGAVTSSPANNSALSPKGRGVYAVELATLSASGVPTVPTSVSKIWSATYGTTAATSPDKHYSNMTFSFPAEITAIDSGNDGYTDRLYAVDTGGNLWRFNVDTTDPATWTAKVIFSSNDGTVGRKVFYKPSVVSEFGYKLVYFGTGDREHPLNTNIVDRIYAFKDPDINTFSAAKTEADLVDVTDDSLQNITETDETLLNGIISNIFTQLKSSTKYGWYIKLEPYTDHPDIGEKVLAAPTVFNKVLYVTTYAPSTTTSATSCTGNLGTARIYALDYKTGEAVFNYDNTNDGTLPANLRARDASGHTLTRSDRTVTLGSGIPSGIVVIISPGGQASIMAGVGGRIATVKTPQIKTIFPYYWRKKK